MASGRNVKFGAFIRSIREEREFGSREMAKKIGISPTYLVKVERDEFSPPAEDKVRKIVEIFAIDLDELMALAWKISSHLSGIIKEHPRELVALLRTTKGMTADNVAKLIRETEKSREFSCAALSDVHIKTLYPTPFEDSGFKRTQNNEAV